MQHMPFFVLKMIVQASEGCHFGGHLQRSNSEGPIAVLRNSAALQADRLNRLQDPAMLKLLILWYWG
jgi:hypothetical protein